jgi:hypothetical protein
MEVAPHLYDCLIQSVTQIPLVDAPGVWKHPKNVLIEDSRIWSEPFKNA